MLAKLEEFFHLVKEVWVNGIYGVDIGKILVALTIFALFMGLRNYLTNILVNRFKFLEKIETIHKKIEVTSALEQPIKLIPISLAIFFTSEYLGLETKYQLLVNNILKSLILTSIFWAAHNLVIPIEILLEKIFGKFTNSLRDWLNKVLRVVILTIAAVSILEIWGIKVGPILAGLGLVGVAVALGAQDLFKNLISGILIIAEKRFNIGDWILVDGVVEGTVESIGFRSTLVRRFDKAPVYVPNVKLSDSAVTNFTGMTYRRIRWDIGISYDATIEQLKKIRDGIEDYIIHNEDFASPEVVPTFIRIDSFGESSIDIALYCFTNTTQWLEWLEIKENLAFKIKEIVEEAGCSFAFPSRSLYIERFPEERPEIFIPPKDK